MAFVVSGCNSGIGLELVKQLRARGETVYGLVRKTCPELDELGCAAVVTGVDVTDDECGTKSAAALAGVEIGCLVLNAGGFGTAEPFEDSMHMFSLQSLENISMASMRKAFEMNSLGPLKMVKALRGLLKKEGGKIAIISTMLGSISDNTSGGSYAYRTSKAAVNMIGKCLAMDLKKEGIAVSLIHPGMVATNFAEVEKMPEPIRKQMRPVTPSVAGVVQAIDSISLEETGNFIHANYGEGLKPCPW
mmetsp:Transcript_27922/g.69346  ORF Transcript_27922/g.69346 Transcript_27922/m.69346 type:complete len:247 (+) Transcript_27922:29-769(+)|eukprot:CAMPEP_0182819488 /NCGR_PEP_ID=MMETSP0006_2-20121128/12605_1 /TAXON_ID=97485 /ORGANISM="Prymnesium parvum, Strain Texoma1" /LENGTH=246 /DNA_ID=CAMNT_0024946065 /DNA_START=22 /DNA_END=762 /DNA_ORIENTATION=+